MSSRDDSAATAPVRTRFEAYLDGLQRFGIRPGLERIRALLALASQPQQAFPVVLVGGTNGKGSTCEFLARGLAAEGYRTGLYTSPHLYRWNERLRVLRPDITAGVAREPFADAITDEELDALLDDTLPLLRRVAHEHGRPTEFETLTLMGLWHFARSQCDIAVVEVGLGGRWDATNANEPAVSVITHVALDHCDRLGESVEIIAADKVQIARPGRILVTAETQDSVIDVFRDHCDAIGAKLWPLRAPHRASPGDASALNHCLDHLAGHEWGGGAMPGFQRINAQTAAVARWALSETLQKEPAALPAPAPVPGRAEVLSEAPLVIVDGSNNPDGAARLAEHLQREYPGRKFIFVVGISADKDYRAMISHWAPLASRFIATEAAHPRAADASLLADTARHWLPGVETIRPVREAFSHALSIATRTDAIVICGSFFVLGEIDRDMVEKSGRPRRTS